MSKLEKQNFDSLLVLMYIIISSELPLTTDFIHHQHLLKLQ